MTDPKRWLDEAGGATLLERDLLRDGLSMDPPPGAQNNAWAALILRIDAGGGGPGGDSSGGGGPDLPATGLEGAGAAAGAAAAPSAGALSGMGAGATAVGGGILKSALIGVACAGVVVAGYSAVVPDPVESPADERAKSAITTPAAVGEAPRGGNAAARAEPLSPSATAAALAPTAAAVAVAAGRDGPKAPGPAGERAPDSPPPEPPGAGQDPASPALEAAPATPSGAEPAISERASRIREESLMLGQARVALRGGNAGEALRLLELCRARFPDGALGQEREALTIEALARSGNGAAASARAAAFVRAYPQSPHAQSVQVFVK